MYIRPSPETSMPVCLGTNAELVPMPSLFLSSPSTQSVSCSAWVYPSSSFQLVSISMQPWGWRLGAFYTRGQSMSIFVFFISWDSGVVLVLLYSSSFEMVFDQKMRSISSNQNRRISVTLEWTSNNHIRRRRWACRSQTEICRNLWDLVSLSLFILM